MPPVTNTAHGGTTANTQFQQKPAVSPYTASHTYTGKKLSCYNPWYHSTSCFNPICHNSKKKYTVSKEQCTLVNEQAYDHHISLKNDHSYFSCLL